jgi:hypothetical protein
MAHDKTVQKQRAGRPSKYASDEERKAARATAARERRARQKAQGLKEVRRFVKITPEQKPQSSIIDLSAIPNNQRPRGKQ